MKVRDIAYCIAYPFAVAGGFVLGKLIDWYCGPVRPYTSDGEARPL